MTEDMRLQTVEVKQSMNVAKTPVEHSNSSLEVKVTTRDTTEIQRP